MQRRDILKIALGGAACGLAACAPNAHAQISQMEMAKPTQVAPTKAAAAKAVVAPVQATSRPKPKQNLPNEPVAPYIAGDTWINTKPIAWDSLRGKVTMVEFWTFGCINCQNVTPSLVNMYSDYKDKDFTIVAVHSPEFDYEKKLANVQAAVKRMGIQYPVVLDNDFANWYRYGNRYWPARYLVDKRGVTRYTHIGEGAYAETRTWIETLIAE